MRNAIRLIGAVAVFSLLLLPGASLAEQAEVAGSFTAEATPMPVRWPVNGDGCMTGEEGLHKVTKSLEAPFSGWLRVTTAFQGDWDLALLDSRGKGLAWSEFQETTDESKEALDYFVRAGETVQLAVCNAASPTPAEVRYVLKPGAAWSRPPGKGVRTHTEVLNYVTPSVGTNDHWVICHTGRELGCPGTTAIRPSDRYVYIEVDDTSDDATGAPGQMVSADVYQYSGTTYLGEEHFCTSTDDLIPLKPGVDYVGVSILLGPCTDGDPAIGTQGKVTAVFTNRKA